VTDILRQAGKLNLEFNFKKELFFDANLGADRYVVLVFNFCFSVVQKTSLLLTTKSLVIKHAYSTFDHRSIFILQKSLSFYI